MSHEGSAATGAAAAADPVSGAANQPALVAAAQNLDSGTQPLTPGHGHRGCSRNGRTLLLLAVGALLIADASVAPPDSTAASAPGPTRPQTCAPGSPAAPLDRPDCQVSGQRSTGKGAIPAGLPKTLFIGLATWQKSQFAWIASSGVPWGAVYQYIDEGVNTGRGWRRTWGANFARNYARMAHDLRLIPVFTYYQLLQSTPHYKASESIAEFLKINNAATMRAYYADFKALLRQVAEAGGPIVIHVEPDLWGYLESVGVSANELPAAVASSGDADLAGYPNTVAGFGQALVHLRDRYAPHVVMAAHVSTWTWNLSTKATLDEAEIGRRDAAFMTGTGNWDLFFTDISDRDAGWYQVVAHDEGRHWWDPGKRKFPNFERLNVWADAFTSAAHRRLVIWQIPIGNQIMDTCNNTSYHYQDNRAQYWLQNYPTNRNLRALARAGVIGLLFGSGGSTATDNYNASGAGIYNPPPINGNTTIARYPDDDGGYLRLRVAGYYEAGPVPLP